MIKPANKGECYVVMNYKDYRKEGLRQLSDPNFYQKLEANPTEKHRLEVKALILRMYIDGEIDDSVYLYLKDKECRTPHLYLLPKYTKE